MTDHPTPREVFERFAAAGVSGDVTSQADLYTEDGVLEFPLVADPVPHRFQGRAAIRRTLQALRDHVTDSGTVVDPAATRVTLHDTTDPRVLVAEIALAITLPTPTVAHYVQVFTVEAGLIRNMRDYFGPHQIDFVTRALRD
ncbi:SnoaL-like protein [Stackebrandtia albiflava]|uniref:SnoaL-like protein n=1 Tax=Stackebrandtia albiflava TaxID=406432 RepID=A0A562V161_9ACTN|nr:nuclear transport factor 2 family protein [Stackebrandtia albiflava]TWJ11542.1 SnoaL-like protein [Stackebrandtia albiflava]